MRNLLFIISGTCLLSCNTAGTTKTGNDSTATTASAPEEKVSYAYTIEHPDTWEQGDKKNTAIVLASLKAFENGDIASAVTAFADTVKLEFDYYEARLSHDSLTAMFTKERGKLKSMTIRMEDWESVTSKDKSMEYVSLWYKQIITDEKGKVDSVECMDDMRMKNGKIILLNEKIRHFDANKKK